MPFCKKDTYHSFKPTNVLSSYENFQTQEKSKMLSDFKLSGEEAQYLSHFQKTRK